MLNMNMIHYAPIEIKSMFFTHTLFILHCREENGFLMCQRVSVSVSSVVAMRVYVFVAGIWKTGVLLIYIRCDRSTVMPSVLFIAYVQSISCVLVYVLCCLRVCVLSILTNG